ncbi:MAG: hypothetical protein ACU0B5_02065 [Roseovarius sp.]
MTSPAERGVPIAAIRADLGAERIEKCARCGGHFPAPGVARLGRIYCCVKCAGGPDGRMRARMRVRKASQGAALVVLGAAMGWLAAHYTRKT